MFFHDDNARSLGEKLSNAGFPGYDRILRIRPIKKNGEFAGPPSAGFLFNAGNTDEDMIRVNEICSGIL
jgi:hypothetical protein